METKGPRGSRSSDGSDQPKWTFSLDRSQSPEARERHLKENNIVKESMKITERMSTQG